MPAKGVQTASYDAGKTAELLGFTRKTINRYYKIFWETIANYQNLEKDKIVGIVEVDEHPTLRGRAGVGIFERNGRVYTEIVADVTKSTLVSIIP